MQEVYERPKVEMQRDMDLIRDLLVNIAEDLRFDGTRWFSPNKADDFGVTNHSVEEVAYHLTLLIEAEYLDGKAGMGVPAISRLTWDGHEFLDNIRDTSVWEKTKERLQGIPGVALSVVAAIAEAEIKKRLGLSP
jgi:hypothetical protein